MSELFSLLVNGRLYVTTDLVEMTAFAIKIGAIGQAESVGPIATDVPLTFVLLTKPN